MPTVTLFLPGFCKNAPLIDCMTFAHNFNAVSFLHVVRKMSSKDELEVLTNVVGS